MDRYRVKYWCEDGAESYISTDSLEVAEGVYRDLDGLAEIQQYNEDRHEYEAFVYPEFEC